MAIHSPDTYVLYALPRRPPWPAVVCRDKDVPQSMLEDRSNAFVVPVLLLQKLELQWAMPGELLVLHDLEPPEDSDKWAGLNTAYGHVRDAYQNDLHSTHWLRLRTVNNETHGIVEPYKASEDRNSTPYESEYDDDDEGLRLAISASLRDQRGAPVVAETSNPLLDVQTSIHGRPNTDLPVRSRDKSQSIPSPTSSVASSSETLDALPAPSLRGIYGARSEPLSTTNSRERTTKRRRHRRTDAVGPSKKRKSFVPDEEEGSEASMEVDEDEGLCSFTVGLDPDKGKFLIPVKKLKKKLYFNGPHLSFLQPVGKNLKSYVFVRPCLRDLDPDDFTYVAEYLSTKDFGHRRIEDWDQRAETVEQCYGAWRVAQELGMFDLMEKIIEKMKQARPWEMEEVLHFATLVYDTPVAVLPEHEEIKGELAAYIAENFWTYMDTHLTTFTERLRQCPALEYDVLERRMVEVRRTIDAVQEDSSVEETEEE